MSARSQFRFPTLPTVLAMGTDQHCIVEASAGTGKTYLLERRVADLIIRGAATIDQILLVTFTEKATAELKRRIREFLLKVAAQDAEEAEIDSPHWLLDELALARVDKALVEFDRASISTIHGFCQRLVQQTSFASGRLLEQSQAPDRQVFGDAFLVALRERIAVDTSSNELLSLWLDRGNSVGDLELLLFRCAQMKAEIRPIYCRQNLVTAIEEAKELLVGKDEMDLLSAFELHTGTRKACAKRIHTLTENIAEISTQSSDAAILHALSGVDIPFLVDRLPSTSALSCVLAELDKANPQIESVIAQTCLPIVSVILEDRKSTNGLFDFGDMLDLAWTALSGEQGLELTNQLRSEYPFALIDEFQDTDPVQWKIFRQIYVGAPRACLTVVGDPKQAIYSFRGADFQTYIDAQAELEQAGASRVRLNTNFRSTPEMVEALNCLFQEKDETPFFGESTTYQPVQAGTSKKLERYPESHPLVLFETSGCRTIKAVKEQLREQIAQEISCLLENKPVITVDGLETQTGPEDIFVLTRTTAEADEVADCLRRHSIPCMLFHQEGLFQSPQALDWIDLLLAIATPEDPSLRLRAWQTGFFDVPLESLSDIANGGDNHPMAACFFYWNRLGREHEYEKMLSDVLRRSKISARKDFCDSNRRALVNYQHLFELLLEVTISGKIELSELTKLLMRWTEKFTDWDMEDRNVQRAEAQSGAVQIMTMHKSKGLEAPFVFLYGGFSAFPTRSTSVQTYRTEGKRVVRIGRSGGKQVEVKALLEQQHEDARLMYVAATRAVAKLYLPFQPNEKPAFTGCYSKFNEQIPPLLERAKLCIKKTHTTKEQQPNKTKPLVGFSPSVPQVAESVVSRIRERRGAIQTSYSKMKRFTQNSVEKTEELETNGLPGGRETGLFLHHVLEHISLDTFSLSFEEWSTLSATEELFSTAAQRYDRTTESIKPAKEMVFDCLTKPILPIEGGLAPLASCQQISREVEFLYPDSDATRLTYVTGYLDALIEIENKQYIVDWKSDLLPNYNAETLSAHVAEHYNVQVDLYSESLKRILEKQYGEDWFDHFGGLLYVYLRGPSIWCSKGLSSSSKAAS